MASKRKGGVKSSADARKSFIVVRMIPMANAGEMRPRMAATRSSFNKEAFKRAVDFDSKKKAPCRSSWRVDVRSVHVRNKSIKDTPYPLPECCADLFNQMRDRKNARKLNSYGLEKYVRPFVRGVPEADEYLRTGCYPFDDTPFVQVPECYVPDECDSSDDDEDDYDDDGPEAKSSECSGCSTLGTGFKRRVPRKQRVDFRLILKKPTKDPCEKIVRRLKSFRSGI